MRMGTDMDRKNLPLILMLVAGVVTSIITFIKQYTMVQKLFALLVTLVVFYALGSLIRWLLDTFQAQNEKAALDEGAVLEKENSQESDTDKDKDKDKDKEKSKEKDSDKDKTGEKDSAKDAG